MPLSGISHGNPSRIPPRAGDGSPAPAGWGGGGGSDGFPPQLLFKQHSLSLSSVSLCNYLSMPLCTFVVWEGCLLANSCLELQTLMSQYLFLFFHLLCYVHQVHKQLSLEMSNSHELFPKFVCCKMEFGSYWKSVFSLWLMNAGISALLIKSYFREINPHQKTKLYVCIVWILCDAMRFW